MEFDWSHLSEDIISSLNPRDVEESFEDAFAVKLLPDSPRFSAQARFFNMGRSANGVGIFSLYRTNGKLIRVICARPLTEDEHFFYQRRLNRLLA